MDRTEHPKRTRGDEDESSAHHHGLEKLSETLKDGNKIYSRTGMPDMSDSAWLVIKLRTDTQKGMATTEVQSVELLQKDIENVLVTVSSSLDEETIQQICGNPDSETAFNVMVKRRRAEVKVSTFAAEQKRELVEAKDEKGTQYVCQVFCGRGSIASGNLTVCIDGNALGCDV